MCLWSSLIDSSPRYTRPGCLVRFISSHGSFMGKTQCDFGDCTNMTIDVWHGPRIGWMLEFYHQTLCMSCFFCMFLFFHSAESFNRNLPAPKILQYYDWSRVAYFMREDAIPYLLQPESVEGGTLRNVTLKKMENLRPMWAEELLESVGCSGIQCHFLIQWWLLKTWHDIIRW